MPPAPHDDLTVEAFLRRRERHRRAAFAVLVLLMSTALLGNAWQQYRGGDDWAAFDRRFVVVQAVMSGDRLAVESADGSVTRIVRLLGTDAPGLADPPPGSPAALGSLDANRALRDLAQNKRVMLSLPPIAARAADGDLLAYLYPADGAGPSGDRTVGTGPTLNEQLVAAGHAYADRRAPHPMDKPFEQAEADARKKRRGLWATVRDADQPAWRRAWLATLPGGAAPAPGGELLR